MEEGAGSWEGGVSMKVGYRFLPGLKAARKEFRITQRELEEKLGVSTDSCGRWERMKARAHKDVVEQIVVALGTTEERLYSGRSPVADNVLRPGRPRGGAVDSRGFTGRTGKEEKLERKCPECGTQLNRYNKSVLCHPCEDSSNRKGVA